MKFLKLGKHSGFVGLIVNSEFFKTELVITRYYSDDYWFFRFIDGHKEHQNGSPLSYFIKSGRISKRNEGISDRKEGETHE